MEKKYFIETFGCQMNEFDSERISFILEKEGYKSSNSIEESNIIVINTCAVREKTKNKLYGHIGNLKKLKENNKNLLICVGGCSAQSLKDQILKDFPYVDIVFGTHNISKLPYLIEERKKVNSGICEVIENNFDYDLRNFKNKYNFKACLPISIGCNNFCSYCIVPYVRGREISLNPNDIIQTARRLVDEGVVEITLVGQNVNSYGKDLPYHITFAELLNDISQINGLKRIRFITSHPKDISEDLINVIAEKENIMNHIHLPLQSGSNKVLKLMNRGYTKEYFLEIVENIRKKIKDCSITTDIITGFPGEERKDFEETLDLVNKIRFNRAFTFIFSKRYGTKAYNLKDDVPLKEKKIWFNELVLLQNKISQEENNKLINKEFKVLVEGEGTKDLIEGRLENNLIVNFKGEKKDIGKFINVKITQAKSFYLIGEKIKK
jgi:tRNA-2-methylthio-N6-dimethylallyladenosine synthase